jgi:hypothetical protein
LEEVIKNNMILWANKTRLQVPNISNQRRMFIGVSQELTKARPPIPFRQLLTILKLWFKDIGGTTPYM